MGGSVVNGKERRGFREELKSPAQWWALVQIPRCKSSNISHCVVPRRLHIREQCNSKNKRQTH